MASTILVAQGAQSSKGYYYNVQKGELRRKRKFICETELMDFRNARKTIST